MLFIFAIKLVFIVILHPTSAWNGSCEQTVSHKHISMIAKQAGIKVYYRVNSYS